MTVDAIEELPAALVEFAGPARSQRVHEPPAAIADGREIWQNALQMQRIGATMKTATFPSLRVDPALRQAAEQVLQDGESLSSFVEQSIRESVERRQAQREFIARGLRSREHAQRTGKFVSSEAVTGRLEGLLSRAKTSVKARR
jgi:predicted transcriptional regulator